MPKYVPIITKIGTLKGRDAIFLDRVTMSERCNTLRLAGEINCNLASKSTKAGHQAYQIRFHGILAFQMIELESWDPSPKRKSSRYSSFDEVIDSAWLARLHGKVSPNYRHFIFQTYDHVFEVLCMTFELELKGIRT